MKFSPLPPTPESFQHNPPKNKKLTPTFTPFYQPPPPRRIPPITPLHRIITPPPLPLKRCKSFEGNWLKIPPITPLILDLGVKIRRGLKLLLLFASFYKMFAFLHFFYGVTTQGQLESLPKFFNITIEFFFSDPRSISKSTMNKQTKSGVVLSTSQLSSTDYQMDLPGTKPTTADLSSLRTKLPQYLSTCPVTQTQTILRWLKIKIQGSCYSAWMFRPINK